jgi:hypothetical protein
MIDWSHKTDRQVRRRIAARIHAFSPDRCAAFERLEARLVFDGLAFQAFEVSSLGELGVTIYGVDAQDRSGRAVASAGDFNGDGFDDVVIGAEAAASLGNSRSMAGESYVVFGGPALRETAAIDLGGLGHGGLTIAGADASDVSGKAVRGAGDVNGDGFDDLLIGAGQADGANDEKPDSGETYLIFGKADWSSTPLIDLASITDHGVTFYGIDASDKAGWLSVGPAGDVNGDGYGDLVIGAPHADGADNRQPNAGEAYLVFGKSDWSSTPTVNLADPQAAVRFIGGTSMDWTGWSVHGELDLNGDGFDDFVIGASNAMALTSEPTRRGVAYVIFGRDDWTDPGTILLAELGNRGLTITGRDVYDDTGAAVSSAGDINGDGFDDLVIGAYSANSFNNARQINGEVYLLFGKAGWSHAHALDLTQPGNDVVTVYGVDAGDRLGKSVAGVGDINGDGLDDLLIGGDRSSGLNNGKELAGDAYVLLGRTQWPQVLDLAVDNSADMILYGNDVRDQLGRMVSGAGDVDGDGLSDFLIAAFCADGEDNRTVDAGETYLVFGQNLLDTLTHQGTPAADVLLGTATVDRIAAGQGNDRLVGAGGPDVLLGGAGDDIIVVTDPGFQRVAGGNGFDTLRIEATGGIWDFAKLADNRLSGIERIEVAGRVDAIYLNGGEVLRLSDHANTLIIHSEPDTRFELGPGWSRSATEILDGHAHVVYQQGAATVKLRQQPGDVNRDGIFNSSDLIAAFQRGRYGDAAAKDATFEDGDWDGDGDFDSSDLVFAFQLGAYSAS